MMELGEVDVKNILTDEEVIYASNRLYKVGAMSNRKYSSAEYNNLDITKSIQPTILRLEMMMSSISCSFDSLLLQAFLSLTMGH